MWVFELPEEDKMQALKNMMAEEVFRLVKGFYSANSLPIDSTVPVGTVHGPQPPPVTQPKKNQQENSGASGAGEAAAEDAK